HALQAPDIVHDREQALRARSSIAAAPAEALLETGDGEVTGHGGDVSTHHLTDEGEFERVERILAADVTAAPRELLGEDRAAQREHRQSMSNEAGDQQRDRGVEVVC